MAALTTSIDSLFWNPYTFCMEVHLTPEKEAMLHQLATRTGKETAQVVEEAVDRLLEYDAHFIREVEKGLAQVERGEVLTHEEVGARLETLFASRHHPA